jgi:DNA-binding NtrC family response regulator
MNKLMDLDSEDVILPIGGKLGFTEEEAYEKAQKAAQATAVTKTSAQVESTGLVSLEEVERGHIFKVLAHTKGNKSEAATILGVTIKTLYNKLHSYAAKGIDLGENKIHSPKK